MSLKYFLANELSLKVNYKIFYIDQFFCKIFYKKTNIRKYFSKNKTEKSEKYYHVRYFLFFVKKKILNKY